jgi:hypothetical protein
MHNYFRPAPQTQAQPARHSLKPCYSSLAMILPPASQPSLASLHF